jgi:6-phosphogluconolactonase
VTRSDPSREVAVSEDAAELSRAVASRLVRRLVELQADGRVPSMVLTGGTIADAIHRAVPKVPEHRAVDWSRVEIWFGDERFVAPDDPERNAGQAREALLARLPFDPSRVHEMPATGGAYDDDVDAAAAAYAEELTRVLGTDPRFDVLMLGIGPDGHCASLFPGRPEVTAPGLAVGVHDAPKPPPTRISLTMEMLNAADEVWFVASGEAKAGAVRDAVDGADIGAVPAAGPRGRLRTCFLLDADAASLLTP